MRHAANNHQRISARDPGERGPVVAGEGPRSGYLPRGAVPEVPGVPRLAAQDPLPARERAHRKLAAAAAEHDCGHLEHVSGLICVSPSIACLTFPAIFRTPPF